MAQGKSISSLMTENRKFPAPNSVKKTAYVKSFDEYQKMWEQSINDPDGFWLEQAETLTWFKKPTKSLEYTWDTKARNDRAHLVRRRRAERLVQLPRPAPGHADRQEDGHHLAGRRRRRG